MRSFIFAGAVGVALVACAAQAQAETKLVSLLPRVLAFEPAEAGSRTLKKGEVLWNVGLRWPKAAVIDQPVQLAADTRRANLNAGEVLAETRLKFDDPALANAVAYCVARKADPQKATFGMLGGILGRSLTDGQFCIVDKDRDGVADMSVLVNAGSPAARTPVAVAPIPYHTEIGAAVGTGDYARLVYVGGQKFELEIYEQGSKRKFDTFMTRGNYGQETFTSLIRPAKHTDDLHTPSGTLHIRAYDKASGSITVDWDARTRLKLMPVPDDVQTTVRFY